MTLMKTQSNLYLFLIALISAMGGFLFGYDWVVIGGAKPFYEQYFQIAGNPVLQGWAAACPQPTIAAVMETVRTIASNFFIFLLLCLQDVSRPMENHFCLNILIIAEMSGKSIPSFAFLQLLPDHIQKNQYPGSANHTEQYDGGRRKRSQILFARRALQRII